MAITWQQQVYALLEHIKPTHPLDTNDSIAIFKLVQPMLPAGFKLDVMHDKTAICVKAYDGRGLLVFESKLVTNMMIV